MNYLQQKQDSLSTYQKMLKKYEEYILSPDYDHIKSVTIFDIIDCERCADILQVFKDIDDGSIPKLNITKASEAKELFLNIIKFNKVVNSLLDNVAYLNEIITLKEDINKLVKDDPYLPESLELPSLGKIEKITKNALKELPEYQKNMTKSFKNKFIESLIYTLPKDELNILISDRIIKPNDLDNIKITYNQTYAEKVEYLCDILGHTPMNIMTFDIKIKGTTFKNEDGTSRQEYLKALEKTMKEIGPQTLYAKETTYKPEMGREEPAVKIIWNDKCLGFVDKILIKDLKDKYNNLSFSVSDVQVNHKDDTYGCSIKFIAASPKKIKEPEIQLEK